MKNSRKIAYSILSVAGICAVVAVVLLTSTAVAHGSYGCNYYGCTQTYNYGSYQYPPSQPTMSPLTATCYASPLSTYVGNTVIWSSSVSGGNGSYNITWNGDEGLSGYGSSISKVYSYAGMKNASMTVVSGGQSVSVNCSESVNVTAPSYSYSYPSSYPSTYNNYYPSNNYNNYNNGYAALAASCSANTNYTTVGSPVTWTAAISGGSGYYTYTWSGTDGLYGSNQTTTFTYGTPGSKTAYVTVYSNGQSTTAYCANPVNITAAVYYGTNYNTGYNTTGYVVNSNTANTLDIGCYADPATVSINQPVTWNVEVTGGIAPYTYTWTGSDGLAGTQSTSIKYYATAGQKNAIVAVTSADGKTGTRSCSNAVTVRRPGAATTGGTTGTAVTNTTNATNATTTATSTNQSNPNGSQLSGSAIFSFDNVPWGWIAVLIILVLFATVMYLLFNKQKI